MDEFLKALSDKNRRKIIGILDQKERSVNDILEFLEISQATLSSHLAILRKTNIVNFRIEGKKRIYSLNKKTLAKRLELLEKKFGINKEMAAEEIIARKDTNK